MSCIGHCSAHFSIDIDTVYRQPEIEKNIESLCDVSNSEPDNCTLYYAALVHVPGIEGFNNFQIQDLNPDLFVCAAI